MAYQLAFVDPLMHVKWIFLWGFFCFVNAGRKMFFKATG